MAAFVSARRQKLDSIGFPWGEEKSVLFDKKFSELIAWRKKHGHFKFPATGKLSQYGTHLRKHYVLNDLPPENIQQLQSLGFNFEFKESNASIHEKKLQQYEQFFQLHAHGNVTAENETDKELIRWLELQRKFRLQGILSKEDIQRLEAAGIDWNYKRNFVEQRWNKMYAELLQWYQKTGTTAITLNKAHEKLYGWCAGQRAAYREGKISEVRIKKLNDINFQWDMSGPTWEENFAALQTFRDKYGHCTVPYNHTESESLGSWCAKLRNFYRKGKLSPEEIKKLQSLNFTWDISEKVWLSKYNILKEHLENNTWDNLYNKMPNIGDWVTSQRRYFKCSNLSEERIRLLNMLGVDWYRLESAWNTMFEEFVKYKQLYSDTQLWPANKTSQRLRKWCVRQRAKYRENKIPEDQLKLLNDAGFKWKVTGGTVKAS